MSISCPSPQKGVTLIRQSELTDAPAIAEVQIASWMAAYSGIVPANVLNAQSIKKQEFFWRGVLSQKTDNVLVAVNDSGNLLAWVSFGQFRKQRDTKEKGEIYAIYSKPEYFRTGVGRLLWEHARLKLQQQGFSSVFALVVTENHSARAFYERMGFKLVPNSGSTFTWECVQIADVCYEYKF